MPKIKKFIKSAKYETKNYANDIDFVAKPCYDKCENRKGNVVMTNKEWFKKAQYGMMVHFGLYSVLGGEWQGKRMGSTIGEWAQAYFRIPNKEYEKLADVFNPIYFNADEWVDVAVEAGMKYLVVTTKHHEGFALFHSKADKFNVVDATPFKRDIIKELAEACAKKGLKLGLYYSQALDWRERNAGGWGKECGLNVDGMSWGNTWDFPDNEGKDYGEVFERKIKPQVKELLTNYGDIALIWFDTPHTISEAQSKELYDMVKTLQPDCLINSRIGAAGCKCDYISWGDNEIPNEYQDGSMLFETPATLNDTWGYKPYDQNWKSAETIKKIRKHLNDRGINYLLNVGPDYLGRIPAPCVEILKQAKI